MWIQLSLVMLIRVVFKGVCVQENSSEVNTEARIHDGARTFLHILDAEVLTDLCSRKKAVMLPLQSNKHRLPF